MIKRLRRWAGRLAGPAVAAILMSLSLALVSPNANAQSGIVVASDAFDRADELPLVVGANWQRSLAVGDADLAANRVSGNNGDAVYFWQGSGTFDDTRQYARARVAQKSGQLGLVLLGGTGQALIAAWNNSGTLFLYWYTAGVYQGNLTTASSTLQIGDLIEAELLDGTVYAKVNGTIVASAVNTTSLSAGRPGFETYLTGGSLDDWEAGTPPALSISGTISENAIGLGGVHVGASGLFGGSATTDVNGAYVIPNVPSGAASVVLTPIRAGHTMTPLTRTIAGPVAGNVVGEDFTSTPSNNPVAALDNFDRAAEGSFVVGKNWQRALIGGVAQLADNRVSGVSGDAVFYWQGTGNFDDARQYARARVTQKNGQLGLVLLGGTGQAIVAAWSNNGSGAMYVYWYAGGVNQGALTTTTSTLQIGDWIEAELIEGRIYARVNGTIVASAVNTTSLTAGRPGFETFLSGSGLDDWEAGTPVAHTISGTISEDAVGLTGVLVSASGGFGASATTDTNGAYSIPGVPNGATSIVLTPILAGHTMTPTTRTIAGPVTQDVVGQDFVGTPPSTSFVIATENFDRATETPLVVGGNWQRSLGSGTAQLAGNQIAGLSGDAIYFWQGPGTFDNARQYAQARVAQTNGQLGLVLLGGVGQAIVAAWSNDVGGTFHIFWYSGGVSQGNLMTGTSALQVGDLIEAELIDGRVYARVNGTIVASATNTTSLTAGRPGFETFLTGGGLDDWEAGTPPAFSIAGTISENAVGLAGVLVSASGVFGASTTTDANGAYTLPSVPGGATAIVLKPILAGHTMTPLTRTVAGPVTANVVAENFTSAASTSSIVAADNFDRAAETPVVVGGNWQRSLGSGASRLAGNRITGSTNDGVYFWQGPGTFDNATQYARARVTQTNGQLGLVLLGGSNQAIIAAWSNDVSHTFYIYRYVGGVNQGNLTTATSTLQVGDQIEAELAEGILYARVNGTIIASVANTTPLTSGRPGFETFLTGGGLDDWEAGGSPIVLVACNDGLDNDGDLLVDLADPGCANAADTSEQNAAFACDDGLDNDGDLLVDLADPGCVNATDPSEQNATFACDDGLDNDGDFLVDLADPGCASATDTSEQNATFACDDGLDNDGDALVDLADPGCASTTDTSEQNATFACDDGLDNDGDALVDLADPGCASTTDTSEQNATLACDDGLDNDGDGLADLSDPGCANASDNSEKNASVACDDGLDNDIDSRIDFPADPDCSSPSDTSEASGTPVPTLPLFGLVALVVALVGTAGAYGARGKRTEAE